MWGWGPTGPPKPPWHGPFGGLVVFGIGFLAETAIGELPWDHLSGFPI